jgi:hypothetical protein
MIEEMKMQHRSAESWTITVGGGKKKHSTPMT